MHHDAPVTHHGVADSLGAETNPILVEDTQRDEVAQREVTQRDKVAQREVTQRDEVAQREVIQRGKVAQREVT